MIYIVYGVVQLNGCEFFVAASRCRQKAERRRIVENEGSRFVKYFVAEVEEI